MTDEEVKFSRAVTSFRMRLNAEEAEPKQRAVFRGEDRQDEFLCRPFAPMPRRMMEVDREIEVTPPTIFVNTQLISQEDDPFGENGTLGDGDTLTFTEDYTAWTPDGDWITFELRDFTTEQFDALVYTLNGVSLEPIADFYPRLVLYRPGDTLVLIGGVEVPEGANTLVITTTDFSATLNFNVIYGA